MIGLSPYHYSRSNKPVANGYAFATSDGLTTPSLDVFKETLSDYYFKLYNDIRVDNIIDNNFDNTLQHWIDQDIFLYNVALTCGSTPKRDLLKWREFSTEVIKLLNQELNATIFVFMGKEAQYFNQFVDDNKNHIINCYHPAADRYSNKPLFRKQNIFKQINKIKYRIDETKINWISNDEASLFTKSQ